MSRHHLDQGFDTEPITEPIPVITPPSDVPGRSRSRRVRALLSLGMVLGLGAVSTLAFWSTSAATTSGNFTTGNVLIQAGGQAAYTFTFPGSLLPGDSTAAVFNVGNVGSVPLYYTGSAQSSSALPQAMTLTVRAGAGAAVSGSTCTGGALLTATPAAITATKTAFVTHRGTVAATSGTDPMCVQLTLLTSAGAALAASSGTVLLTFDGTST